jgi:UPF0755 protein
MRGTGCFVLLGILAIVAFVAFIGGNAFLARAEDAFGPPSPTLNTFQRWRIGFELGLRAEELQQPVDPAAMPIRFDIGFGEDTGQIVARLWKSGMVSEGQLFTNYLIYTGIDTQLQAGSYELSAAMSAVELAAALIDPTPGSVTLSILPGWRLEEIAASLPSAGIGFAPEEFLLTAWSPAGLNLPAGLPESASLEGYLMPGDYEIEREMDVRAGLDLILTQGFHQQVDAQLLQAFEAQGLSLHEAITIASVVERESVLDEEMGQIAAVFLNRVAAGIWLEADPTVQYAVGYDEARGGWWPTPLTFADLAIDSPYNSYRYGPLPPGPIAAPSYEALYAVAFPPPSPYFFFQAACDGSGSHVFALTYEEHLSNNCN